MKNSVRFSKFKRGKFIKVLFLLFLLFFCFQKQALAEISSCTVTVSPSGVDPGTTNDFNFNIVNNDSSYTINWINIVTPSSNFIINGTGGDGSVFQTGMNIPAGTSGDWQLSVTAGANPASFANWTLQASDDLGGANPTTCTGSLGTKIIDPAALIGPVISNAIISSLSNSSVTITWSTDKNASSQIDYGVTNAYGLTKSDPTMQLDHSITIDSLSPITTYHFNIKSTDANGNTVQSGDNFFKTADVGSTGVTQTVTITNTTTTIKTVVSTPVPDTTPPSVNVNTDFSKSFTQSPQIDGIAKDNKAVVKVEYSTDNGENWLPVDNQASIGKPSTTFSFIPQLVDDGNYQIKVKATDSSGNIGYSKTFIMVIDRIPPQVSGLLFSLGPQVLSSRADGEVLVPEGQNFKITLSEVGGAISVDVFADPSANSGQISSGSASKKFSLIKNSDNGLWSANISLDNEGEYQLRFSAVDGAGNRTDRNLNKISVVGSGKINASNAKITVYYFDINTGEWKVWDGSSYGQKNPIRTDGNGNYNLFLPAGKYYLQIESYGFQTQITNFFTLYDSTPINQDFSLTQSKLLLNLGFIKLYWPDFSALTVIFKNNIPKLSGNTNQMIGQKLPFFSLADGFRSDSLVGKESVLTFLNTWAPSSTEQIPILNSLSMNKNFNSATIIEGEKSSKISVFKKRGGYMLPMYTDPDATQATSYGLSVLPTSYFIDRKGIVRDVVTGVLSEQEITDKLMEISN